MAPWNAHTPSGSHMPSQKRRFLLDGHLCQAQYVSRRPHDEDPQQAGPSTQPPSSNRKSYEMYRETPLDEFDLDLEQSSTSSYGGALPPPDIPPGWIIIIRNGPYDEVFLVQSSISFARAYEELCEAMEQLSLEEESEEQQEAEVDEIRAALDRLSFVESCPHDDAGETTLVEWEDSDSETMAADDESCLTVCAEEATRRARKAETAKKLSEEVERAVWNLPTKDIHPDVSHPVRSPPNSSGPWILAAMCKVGLECKACTTPPSYRTLVAPVFQNLIKRA